MSDVLALLQASVRNAREVGVHLPQVVLDLLLDGLGASCGRIGRGEDVLTSRGAGELRRWSLPAGREPLWLELEADRQPSEELLLTAGVVLSSWALREDLKRARFGERRRLWEVESLRAISEALGGTLDPLRIAEELLLHATALLDARRGEMWLMESGSWRPSARVDGAGDVALCRDGSCYIAARVGGLVLSGEEVAQLGEEGLLEASRLAVPVAGRRGLLGVLALAEREVRGGLAPFGPTDRETLALYASQAALALENATMHREGLERERLERELELAAAVQRQLLPTRMPVPEGLEVAARSEPARHVGGDLYDLIALPEGLMVMVADVAGKGVPAALMAAFLHAAVRVLATGCGSLAELMGRLHAQLHTSTLDNKFATVLTACLKPDGTLDFVSAGHNPALLVLPDGRVQELESNGPPIGLLPEAEFLSERTSVPRGSLLLAYTDGFTEAPGTNDEDFGLERFAELAVAHRDEPLDDLMGRLFDEVLQFTGNAPLHDDRTLVAIRRL